MLIHRLHVALTEESISVTDSAPPKNTWYRTGSGRLARIPEDLQPADASKLDVLWCQVQASIHRQYNLTFPRVPTNNDRGQSLTPVAPPKLCRSDPVMRRATSS